MKMFDLAWATLVAGSALAADRPEDFAYIAPLRFDSGSALYEVVLSAETYRRSAFADLRDLRVFNGAGERVPHALGQPPVIATTRRASIAAPFFPLHGDEGKSLEDLRIVIDGHANVKVQPARRRDATAPLIGYLVDVRAQTDPIVALEPSWRDGV
jgi:hypothetical protein